MKVLLMGEYSGVHTAISEQLKSMEGFSVTVVHDGDGYKGFKPDILIQKSNKGFKSKYFKKLFSLYSLILNYFGLNGCLEIFKYKEELKSLKGFDVVQLINPFFLSGYGALVNLFVFFYLKKNNEKIVLLAVGDDNLWVKACLNKKFKYSFFDRMSYKNFHRFLPSLFHVYSPIYVLLNKIIIGNVCKVITGAYDYHLSYKDVKNKVFIPLSIKIKKTSECFNFTGNPISIFHGWQPGRDLKKGNDILHQAILRLENKYPDKIKYNIVGNVSYEKYIQSFNDSVIFVDQCFSYDKGINALLGMSQGKVVLSGNEEDVISFLPNIKSCLINALPDELDVYKKLEFFINNPKELEQISKNASNYVSTFHNISININKYIKVWGGDESV